MALLSIFLLSVLLSGIAQGASSPGVTAVASSEWNVSGYVRVLRSPAKAVKLLHASNTLNVVIRNNMQQHLGANESGGFRVDCVAYKPHDQPLLDMGGGLNGPPLPPHWTVTYLFNMFVLAPNKVAGTFYWGSRVRTVTLYEVGNLKLQSLEIRWSVDERGFSLYNMLNEHYDLCSTW
uniref:Uncharacterized protein n=1 Tax=Apopellia endiviifolia (species B) TaxID=119729 RepID=W5ZR61_9MARC|nr:putative protein MT3 [Apopellia endiviifolia (species B)]